jgi:hypothetical protein
VVLGIVADIVVDWPHPLRLRRNVQPNGSG